MTRIALLVLVVVLPLLLPASAQGYYHPGKGRWLSRDPLAEHSFSGRGSDIASFSNTLAALEVCDYAFTRNAQINVVDALGLKVVCGVTIRAAHFSSKGELLGNYEHYHSQDWSNVPRGDAFGYVGCGANTLNSALQSGNSCAGVSGMPRNNNDDPPTGELERLMREYGIPPEDLAWENEIPVLVDQAFEAAKMLARARCRSKACGCCMNVRVRIECPHSDIRANESYGKGVNNYRESGTEKCGKSTTLDCRTGNFTIFR